MEWIIAHLYLIPVLCFAVWGYCALTAEIPENHDYEPD